MSVSPLSRSLRKSLLPVNPFVFSYPLGRGGWASTLFLFLLVFHWVINWKGVSMRKLLKRFAAAASAVVICGVTCVTSWFSVPVSAAGAFGMLEWLEFQTLLQGIGIGGSNDDFVKSVDNWTKSIGGPEMPREDYDGEWMTNYEYYNRLGWDSIIGFFDNLADSWTEDYSSIPDVGTDVSGGGYYPSGISCSGGVVRFSSSFFSTHKGEHFPSDSFPYLSIACYKTSFPGDYLYLFCISSNSNFTYYLVSNFNNNISVVNDAYSYLRVDYALNSGVQSSNFLYSTSNHPSDSSFSSSVFCEVLDSLGCQHFSSFSDAYAVIKSSSDWSDKSSTGDSFIGPVYTYPAAQELYKSTGTAAGIRLDVQTQDGVPDVQAALDGAGVDTVDDLVAGVAAGTVPMSKVFADAKVTPYVVADTATGAVVTDLGVSATATGVKAVGLTQELAVPKDLTNAVAYPIKGKTWDPDMAKYNLPLFQYFPFCLPWDIYQVLSAFAAEPVAPSITIPLGKFFSGKKSFDGSAAAGITATVDLGDDKFSKWFVMLRALESAGIVIGLVLISVKLIHGGR